MEDRAETGQSNEPDSQSAAGRDSRSRSARVRGHWARLLDRVGGVVRQLERADWAVLALLVVAAVLRLYRLGEESVWLDEALTWYRVTEQYTTVEILFVLPLEDVHPPLYFLLMDLWTSVAGASESALRFPSVVFGVTSVGLLYLFGVKVFDRSTGAIAAALLAVSSFHLYYAQEARMYTLMTALTVVSFYFFVDIADEESHGRLSVLGYLVSTVLLAYTHLFGTFIVLAQNAYLLSRVALSGGTVPVIGRVGTTATSLRGWLRVLALLALMVAPWWVALTARLPTISAGGCTGITWIPEPTPAGAVSILKRYFYYCGTPETVSPIPAEAFLLVMVLAGGLAVAGLFAAGDGRPGSGELLLLVWLLTPIVVPFVLSHVVAPIMVARYTIGASLALFLLVGRGVQTLRPYAPAAVRVALVGVLLLGLVAPLSGYYESDQKRQWRDAVESIESSGDRGDLVLVTKSHLVPTYQYYARRPPDTVVGMERLATRETVSEAVGDRGSVWVVRSWTGRTTLGDHLRSLNYTAVETVRSQGIYARRFVRVSGQNQASRQAYSSEKTPTVRSAS